jgi:hypothetical protein
LVTSSSATTGLLGEGMTMPSMSPRHEAGVGDCLQSGLKLQRQHAASAGIARVVGVADTGHRGPVRQLHASLPKWLLLALADDRRPRLGGAEEARQWLAIKRPGHFDEIAASSDGAEPAGLYCRSLRIPPNTFTMAYHPGRMSANFLLKLEERLP